MRVLKSLFLVLAFVSQITVYASYAPEPDVIEHVTSPVRANLPHQATSFVKNDYQYLIDKYAQIWSVSPELIKSIANCESSMNRYAVNDNPGVELSVGISQINLLAHTNITREQAEDPEFSINFIAKHIASGDAPRMWYTCYLRTTI